MRFLDIKFQQNNFETATHHIPLVKEQAQFFAFF